MGYDVTAYGEVVLKRRLSDEEENKIILGLSLSFPRQRGILTML